MTPAETELLRLEGVGFAFGGEGGRAILADVGCRVAPGEICAVVGPSGVGKSTLLRIMAGQLSPNQGNVRRPGRLPATVPVLYHPQEAMLLPWSTVGTNVELGLRFADLPPSMEVKNLLSKLELDGLADRHPARLSGGQVERTALARTLVTPASVYLLDEPLSGTDYVLRVKIEEFLVGFMRGRQSGAVIVTHDLPQAAALSDFLILIVPGKDAAQAMRVEVPEELRMHLPGERRASEHIGPFVNEMLRLIEGGAQ